MSDPRKLIEKSGLFDKAYYTSTYADLRSRKRDPLTHFLSHGAQEGRCPNRLFDGLYYAKVAGLDLTIDNPLVHYITEGEKAGLCPSEFFNPKEYRLSEPSANERTGTLLAHHLARVNVNQQRAHLTSACQWVDLQNLKVTIIIPVYNAPEETRRCLESLLVETHLPGAKLLIIDDASPDPAISMLLHGYGQLPQVTVVTNNENFGFTRTVNRGIELAENTDVVFLNSDTVVGPAWLEQLALAAYSSPQTATATPLSDSAGAFSTPKAGPNETHQNIDVPTAARIVRRIAPAAHMRVPTGNGFCMYVRRDAINQVGLLDAARFPRGYGEENDWCLRAIEQGWNHVIALSAYVAHINAASFGEGKAERIAEARTVLDARHPDYGLQLKASFNSASLLARQRPVFELEIKRHARKKRAKPRIAYVTSTTTGGTPQTNADLMAALSNVYAPLLLTCDSHHLSLFDASGGALHELEHHRLEEKVDFGSHTSSEYDRVVSDWLQKYGVELLHIRHIGWHSLNLPETAARIGIRTVFSFHDFYTVCPSVNLVADHETWQPFGVTEPQICAPLWRTRDRESLRAARKIDAAAFLTVWKRRMNAMLEHCDALVSTHESARDILADNLPTVRERSEEFAVIPHGRDFSRFMSPPRPPRSDEKLRLLVAGNITESKGMMTLIRIIELDVHSRFEVHVLGKSGSQLQTSPSVHFHGAYQREEFQDFVEEIKPHLSLVLSIWPETFCHTLTESWAAGIPVLGSELGAVGGRIEASGAGWTVAPLDSLAIYELLCELASGREGFAEKCAAVTRWQEEVGKVRTTRAMAADYVELYRKVQNDSRIFGRARKLRSRKRVALVTQGHYPLAPSTVHVRIATAIDASRGDIDYDWIAVEELIRSGLGDVDGVIVCRNAAAPELLQDLASLCKEGKTPLVLDLDDDLLEVPKHKDPTGQYAKARAGIAALLKQAELVTVSTPDLVKRYRQETSRVQLVENKLDRRQWLTPVETVEKTLEGWDEEAKLRVLYTGTYTHKDDLSLVLPAFERLAERGVVLHVVGIEKEDRPGYRRLTAPSDRYDIFSAWLRSIAPHFDVAIAPLVDNAFNRRKSALKYMECAACNLPVIASKTGEYVKTITDGEDGLLATDTDSWVQKLTMLLEQPSLRSKLAEAAQRRVENEFTCNECVFDTVPWGSLLNR